MRKFYLLSTLVFILFCSININAQEKSSKWCFVGDEASSTDRVSNSIDINQNLNLNTRLVDPNGVIIIPVVFHIIYRDPIENIPDSKITAQINRLNTDFRKLNSDISLVPPVWANLAADMKFEFRLACLDPQGNPTNGIIRKQTSKFGFSGQNFIEAKLNELGGDDAWPTNTYLNVWVCDMEGGGGQGMFPWQYSGTSLNTLTSQAVSNSLLDGIVLHPLVIDNDNNPDRGLSRIGVHEVGHWLGLYHTYNEGCFIGSAGDCVDDTPAQNGANIGCPSYPLLETFCNPNPPGVMFMNQMDQVYDACKYMFTIGQRDRARAYFSPNSPPGGPAATRFPFLENYFGIKRSNTIPLIVQNNTITVYLKNPACLPVNYAFTGPVTEISHDNQKIVFSVPCQTNSTLSLTATSGNYIDDYSFNFENQSGCSQTWPKAYGTSDETWGILNAYNGNILVGVNGILENSQFFNHQGVYPPVGQTYSNTVHYSLSGITNWMSPYYPGFALRTGKVNVGWSNIFVDASTGVLINSPFNLAPGEKIMAETSNGWIITNYGNDNIGNLLIRLHSPQGFISSPINVGVSSALREFRYNLVQDNLVLIFGLQQSVFKIWHFDGSNLFEVQNVNTNQSFPFGAIHIDNQNMVYFVDNNGVLKKYDYTANSTQIVIINGFANYNLQVRENDYTDYTDDRMAYLNQSDNYIYVVNFNSNTSRRIFTENITTMPSHIIIEDAIFFTGWYCSFCNFQVRIGTQVIPNINQTSAPIYVAKFSLQSDFESGEQVGGNQPNKKIEFVLIPNPNPTNNNLKINILKNGQIELVPYKLIILNQVLKPVLAKSNYFSGNDIDLNSVFPGTYFVIITNQKGESKTTTFIKL